jgi:hypothetical protein
LRPELRLNCVSSLKTAVQPQTAACLINAFSQLCAWPALVSPGFKRYRLGDVQYYVREPTPPAGAADTTSGSGDGDGNTQQPPPLIFVHGVGMGLATYIHFVMQLAKCVGSSASATATSSRRIMLVELPHVSLKLGYEHVPSVSAFVESTALALKRHKFGPSR